MASGDSDYAEDESSSGFFHDDLDQYDADRDLYAVLHINKDVTYFSVASPSSSSSLSVLGGSNDDSTSVSSVNSSLSSRQTYRSAA